MSASPRRTYLVTTASITNATIEWRCKYIYNVYFNWKYFLSGTSCQIQLAMCFEKRSLYPMTFYLVLQMMTVTIIYKQTENYILSHIGFEFGDKNIDD
jgi:hypothetical protein